MPHERQSSSLGKLAEALSKAQSAFSHAVKDADNPFFKSKYADLPSVIDAVREPLAANGLAIVQAPETDETGLNLVTTLLHSSGEWMRGWYPIKPLKADPQSMGSALTYARRYSLSAMLGVAAVEDDDDGNAASQQPSPESQYRKQQPPAQAPAPQAQEAAPRQAQQQASQRPASQPTAQTQSVKPPEPAKNAAPVPIGNRVRSFEANLVANLLCRPGELIRHVELSLLDKYKGTIDTWPVSATDDVRDACKEFEATCRDGLLIMQPQVDELAKELFRAGKTWNFIQDAEQLGEIEMGDLCLGQWKTIMGNLKECGTVKR